MDAEKAADQLFQAAKGLGTNEDVFIKLLCKTTANSYQQMAAKFQQKYKKDVKDVIISEFSGKSTFAYVLCHECLMSPVQGIAALLNNAMNEKVNPDIVANVTVLFSQLYKDTIAAAYQSYGELEIDARQNVKQGTDLLLRMWDLPKQAPPELEKAADQLK